MALTAIYPPRIRGQALVDEPKRIETGQRWLRAMRVSWLPAEVTIQGLMPFHALVYYKDHVVAIHEQDLLIYFRQAS